MSNAGAGKLARHSGESRNPESRTWIPAFAGMTDKAVLLSIATPSSSLLGVGNCDLVIDPAIGEVLRCHRLPAAELVDVEQFHGRKLAGEFGRHGLVTRTQVVLRGYRLAFRAPQMFFRYSSACLREPFLSTTLSTTENRQFR